MRKLSLVLAALATIGLAAPVMAQDVSVKAGGMHHVSKKVIIKHGDRGLHRAFGQSRHTKKVVIKHHAGGTVVKKKVIKQGGGY